MSTGCGERFPKGVRLLKRTGFLTVQSAGHRVFGRSFMALVMVRQSGPTRLGITTTKKVGNAVRRNRIRRLIREAFRRGRMELPEGIDVVIIAKKTAVHLESAAVFEDLDFLGKKVKKVVEKNL